MDAESTLVATIIAAVGTVPAAVLAALVQECFKHGWPWRKRNEGSIPDESRASTSTENSKETKEQPEKFPEPTVSHERAKTEVYSGGTELIAVGLWGYPYKGNPFDHNGYDGIKTIEIASGDAIYSIKVQYIKRGELVWTSTVGGVRGLFTNKIVFRNGEYINEIRGYSGSYGGKGKINSITFFTNMSRKFGPYGWSDLVMGQIVYGGEPCPFFVTGGKIVGIHGTAGKYVYSIGFYVSTDV